MLYPFKFLPVYKNYLWGGRNLANWGKRLPEEGIVAESWEISGHENGLSIIANGDLAGLSLPEALRRYGRSLAGTHSSNRDLAKFPLLVKLIDAEDSLSVQVHPGDDFARIHEAGEYGKNEMWYVVAARPGAKLIAGIRPDVDPRQFAAALAAGCALDMLQALPVRPGDVINIPAGLVHAIGKGLIICEIQQNSDTTYRVFDYDRKDSQGNKRPLQVEKALAVIDFQRPAQTVPLSGLCLRNPRQPDLIRRILVLNRYFLAEELTVGGAAGFPADAGRFRTLTVLAGQGSLIYDDPDGAGRSALPLALGDSLLIPACLGAWQLSGDLKIISARVANFPADLRQAATDAGLSGLTDAELVAGWSDRIGFDPLP